VLHALDHRLELRRHQTTRLSAGHTEGVLETRRIKPVEGTGGRGGGVGAENDA
jgi:hypothetical protein